jgi:archaellum biogenesis ATPase FlaH
MNSIKEVEMNQYTQTAIFFYVLHNKELTKICKPHYFESDLRIGLFTIAKSYVLKYNKFPTTQEMKNLISTSTEINDEQRAYLSDQAVEDFWACQNQYKDNYDEKCIEDNARFYLTKAALYDSTRQLACDLKLNEDEINIDNYQKKIKDWIDDFDRTTDMSRFDTQSNNTIHTIDDPESVYSPDLQRFQTGDEFIDRVSGGGYWPGSLWAFLGAPKAGKSRLLQNLCVTAYKQCYNVAYISLELPYTLISQRISSNLYNIEMKTWYDKDFIQNKYADVIKDYHIKHPTAPTMSIQDYGTGTLAVSQLEHNLLQQEKIFSERTGKEFKFKCVYVDYINIMKNWKNPDSENTYLKIKQIAEDLRAMAKRNNWCIVTATQTKSTFFDSETINMQSAAESSALQATVDMMFGIISTPEMHQDHEQYLKIILNRVEYYTNYKQKYDINEKYMRLVKANEDMIFDDGITTISKPKKITKKTIEASDKKQLESQNEAKLIANAQELLFK